MMTPPSNQELKCPACGLVVKGSEHTCPQCGRDFGTDFGFECPFCGDFIPKGSTKCPSCLLDLAGFTEKTEEKTVAEMTDQLLDEIISIESALVKREGKHLACPGCHWLLNGDEVKCPKCSRAISSVSDLLCPICLSPVGSNLDRCSRCGSQLEKGGLVPTPPPSPPKETGGTPDQALDQLLQDFKSVIPCPKCGTPVTSGTSVCPKCGSRLSIEEELKRDLQELESIDTIREPPEEDLVDDALSKLGQIDKQAHSVRRSRKLRRERATTVGPQIRPTGRGLTNGVGQTNGNGFVNGVSRAASVGRINGTGFTNGKSMVNGTGVSNGLKPKGRAAGINKMVLLAKRRFLVILVIVVVVISSLTAVFLLNRGERFSADGDFGEWSDAPKFSARVQSASPTIDIVEWSVATELDWLFFFVETRGTIMGSTDAQRYYLFVDTDGSSNTGYLLDSLGAEYLLQVEGWNGTVQSATMYERAPMADQYDFNGWLPSGSFVACSKGSELEAEAMIFGGLGQQSRFMLLSKDALADGAVSYVATSSGGSLVVTQTTSPDVVETGVVGVGSSIAVLSVTFSCEGSGGTVTSVTPVVQSASVASTISPFSLEAGQNMTFSIALDTSGLASGQLVTVEVDEDSIESTFTSIEIIGERASAYVASSPSSIEIDGAFADWANKTVVDEDISPVNNPDIDISEIGNVNISGSSYFFVSVEGEICSGTFIPATIARPSGSGGGGGGGTISPRITAEDILRIYVDSDRSSSTGFAFTASSKTIGADQMIEIRGLHGRIVSKSESNYVSGSWVQSNALVEAEKDLRRIEIGVTAASLSNSSDVDFVIETTTWSGTDDTATMTPSGVRALASSFAGSIGVDDWAVDGSTSRIYATAMSYQRKVFYDGTNYWSFYFDGMNTVHKYSTDDGVTWTRMGTFFKTSGVNETSIWYDSANNVVYAVGDTSTASTTVVLQKGTVNPSGHNISWAASDSTAAVSSYNLAGKNAFICRDTNGYIWILTTNCSQTVPVRYDLTAFKSTAVDSVSSWAYSGQMLAAPSTTSNPKGSIVPAGSGSDVWAVYAYVGNVACRKYTGSWQTPATTIYTGGGSSANTDNSPPSVVVDNKGVVHVVYGTGRKTGQVSIPSIEYAYNNTGATTFANSVDLDPYIPAGVGDYYPTISLETSTNNIYVFWLRSDTSYVPQTVTCRKGVSGTWSNVTISSQTTYAKQYLTSIYSISDESKMCWQWTQNTTSPFEVMFDAKIPEFSEIALPIFLVMVVFVVKMSGSRRRKSGPHA